MTTAQFQHLLGQILGETFVTALENEMLKALRDLVAAIEFTPLGIRALKALEPARAAISKAEAADKKNHFG